MREGSLLFSNFHLFLFLLLILVICSMLPRHYAWSGSLHQYVEPEIFRFKYKKKNIQLRLISLIRSTEFL